MEKKAAAIEERKSGGGGHGKRAKMTKKTRGRRRSHSSLSLSYHGALPPAPPDAISGPLLAAAEVAPGAGDRRLLRLVCEMIRARSSWFDFFVFVFSMMMGVGVEFFRGEFLLLRCLLLSLSRFFFDRPESFDAAMPRLFARDFWVTRAKRVSPPLPSRKPRGLRRRRRPGELSKI